MRTMLIEIVWNSETTQVDLLDGNVKVGGAPADDIRLEGLPHGLLELTLLGSQLSVTAQRSFRIGAALFPARVPRLVVADEALKLPNDVVIRRVVDARARELRKSIDTAAIAEELLGGNASLESTRAPTLTCVTGFDSGRVFAIPYLENTIGRADDAVIRVRDRAVSRRQARLVKRGADFVLEAAASMNPAYVNGIKLKSTRVLKTGDTLELGRTVLRFDAGERANSEHSVMMAHGPALTPNSAPVPAPLAAERMEPMQNVLETVELRPQRRGVHELALMFVGLSFTLLGMAIAAVLVD